MDNDQPLPQPARSSKEGKTASALFLPDESFIASHPTRVAVGFEELTGCFRLVYESYLDSGFIEPNRARLVYQRTFGLSSSRTIMTCDRDGRLAGTLTVVGDNPLGLQIETTYPNEVNALREQGRRLVEVTCLAIDRHHGSNIAVFFSLTRFLFQYAVWRGFDELLLAVHPRHVRFYERYFRARPFGPCRPHRLVRDKPAIACRVELQGIEQRVASKVWDWYTQPPILDELFLQPHIAPDDHRQLCHQVGIYFSANRRVA